MSRIEESKKKLSEAFSLLESVIENRLQVPEAPIVNGKTDEMLEKTNESLIDQNQVLQKKLYELEKQYSDLKAVHKDTSIQIDEIVSNLKKLLVEN